VASWNNNKTWVPDVQRP